MYADQCSRCKVPGRTGSTSRCYLDCLDKLVGLYSRESNYADSYCWLMLSAESGIYGIPEKWRVNQIKKVG